MVSEKKSGMNKHWEIFSEEDMDSFFEMISLNESIEKVVDIGCGFGAFSIPAAKRIKGIVFAVDIKDDCLAHVKKEAEKANMDNLIVTEGDPSGKTDIERGSIDMVFLFNIVQDLDKFENLVIEAKRILKGGGKLLIMHWRRNEKIGIGPLLEMRPLPEQMEELATRNGFRKEKFFEKVLGHHYCILFERN